ncbi:MAG: hypothetical protein LBH06_08965 [Rikenellaceae bacterium]|jgi:hypothetical protein|nr:hypothetical protein [Rikenellaceae bacterium]
MKYICGVVLGLLLAVSCAKRETESYDAAELTSLKAWMKRYIPERHPGRQCDTLDREGIYIVRVTSGTGAEVKANDWLFYDLTIGDLWGNIYYTRDSLTAVVEGTSTLKTHYIPYYNIFTDPNYSVNENALYRTLKQMREGDSAVVYSTSRFTYGSNSTTGLFVGGYQGQSSYPGGIPTVIRVKLHRIVEDQDPVKYEEGLTRDYAKNELGRGYVITPGVDTTDRATWVDTVTLHQYFKIWDAPDIAASYRADREQVVEDSTLKVYYITRFLDGFIIDTNIDSVAWRVWRDNTARSALTYSKTSNSSYVAGMKAVYKMKYSEWCTTVFTSAFGYSYSGVAAADANSTTGAGVATEIRPYTPLIFDLYVADYQ